MSEHTNHELIPKEFSANENCALKENGVDTDNASEQSDDANPSDNKPDEEITKTDQTELLISQSDSCSIDSNENLPEPAVTVPKRRQSWGQIHALKAKRSVKDSLLVMLSFFW